jgi:hypothetical protein
MRHLDVIGMSTAKEVLMKMAAAEPAIERIRYDLAITINRTAFSIRRELHDNYMMSTYPTREVCARRASKLRRKGFFVFKVGKTSTGKQRWLWARCPRLAAA